MESIFIQIASYRDPQLPQTLKHCIDSASDPSRLKFCIAHQYDDTEDLRNFENDSRFKFIKIPYQNSKGACWARNLIQQHYQNETYTLQLDSHHRFIDNWDRICIKNIQQLQSKGYNKPLLTAYLPSYDPLNDSASRAQIPWKMNFDRFTPEGVVFFSPANIENHRTLSAPIPARFYSAHFCFTLGQFCREVPHDPEYYFHGEEISIAVRAYTHGYDLFHPHQLIAWHEYTRQGRNKHWDDNVNWGTLNSVCHLRNRKLLGMDPSDIDFGPYGLGNKRTLREYEEYAGISFQQRAVQQYTLDHRTAPNPLVSDFNTSVIPIFKHCIDIQFDKVAEKDYDFWCVAFHDKEGNTIFRKDADESEIPQILTDPDGYGKIWREFNTKIRPSNWVVWPHSKSKGWCERIVGSL